MRQQFEILGQGFGGAIPPSRAFVLLDTNVVSVLETIARKGFNPESTGHRRAEHLLRWLSGRDDDAILTMFGVLEGAGFHAGAVRPYMLLRRAVAANALIAWARDHLDEIIGSRAPLPTQAIQRGLIDARTAYEDSEPLVEAAVLPSLVAALSCAVADRSSRPPVERAQLVHDRLVSEVNRIPTFGWLTAALLFMGRPDIRNRLRTSLFKLQEADVRQSCLSAAWDLGYLEVMNLARVPQIQTDWLEDRPPVLVTEDGALSWVASSLIMWRGGTGDYAIDNELWDVPFRDAAVNLLEQNQRRRAAVRRVPPRWALYEKAARRLLRDLGVDDAPTLRMRPRTVWVRPERDDINAYVQLVVLPDARDALLRLHNQREGDALIGALWVVVDLVLDNADARRRPPEESWEAIARAITAETDKTDPDPSHLVLGALSIAHAVWTKAWEQLNAALEDISIAGSFRPTIMYLWKIGRMIIDDTANARNIPTDEITRLLEYWGHSRTYPGRKVGRNDLCPCGSGLKYKRCHGR